MKLNQWEQSGVILESKSGFKLAIDIAGLTPIEKLNEMASLDAMLVSHIHGDHFSVPHIKKLAPKNLYLNQECIEALGAEKLASEVVEVKVGDRVSIGDFNVSFFDVDHGPNATLKPKENFGFLIEVDGEKLYFAGDMYYPSGIDVSDLEVDIALLPVGGHYTFGPEEALAFAKQFKKIGQVLPMHFSINPAAEGEFLALIDKDLRSNSNS